MKEERSHSRPQAAPLDLDRYYGLPRTAFWNWVLIRHIHDSMWKLTDRIADRWGLSASQYVTLFLVCSTGGPLRQADLGPWLFQEQNTISGLVTRMEAKGLINRERSQEDRRQVLITATEKGRELAEQIYAAIQGSTADFLSSVDEQEHDKLAVMLSKLRAAAFRFLDISPEAMDKLVWRTE